MSKYEWILHNRTLFKDEINDKFKLSIIIRYVEAKKSMKIDTDNIDIVFCSTLEKHTCLIENDNNMYLVFDEHHLETLNKLNMLYFLYGQIDIKAPIYDLITEMSEIYNNQFYYIILSLKAEGSLIKGDITNSWNYLQAKKNIENSSVDVEKNKLNFFATRLINLKQRHANIAHSYALNFYVYHEMAHIKYIQDKSVFNEILNDLYSISSKIAKKSNIDNVNLIECACDIYAILKLSEYMQKQEKSDFEADMLEVYIISILNLVVMDSIQEKMTWNLEKFYIISWKRIILDISVLRLVYIKRKQADYFNSLKSTLEYVHEKYRNFWNRLYDILILIETKYKDDINAVVFNPFNEEHKKLYNKIIEHLRNEK